MTKDIKEITMDEFAEVISKVLLNGKYEKAPYENKKPSKIELRENLKLKKV